MKAYEKVKGPAKKGAEPELKAHLGTASVYWAMLEITFLGLSTHEC